MNSLIIDIETFPIPEDELTPWIPKLEAFDESAVKVGHLKDPEKIAAKIEDARKVHTIEHQRKLGEWLERRTLDARFSRVYAVGIDTPDQQLIEQAADPDEFEETHLVGVAWQHIERAMIDHGTVAGWNISGFDLPFLWQRAKILGVPTPGIQTPVWRNPWLIELMDRWTLGSGRAKLDDVARTLGLEGKIDLGGKLPWEIAQEDPEKAREYLRRDVELTREIAEKLK